MVAIAIEVRVEWCIFTFFSRRDRPSAVRAAHEKLRSLLTKQDSAILLTPLDDIELNDLRAWRTEMENRWGPRDDDSFGDHKLSRIVRLQQAKPMQDVVEELEKLLASIKA